MSELLDKIITLSAILSAILTAVANPISQHFARKQENIQKNSENNILYKRTIFERYISYATIVCSENDWEYIKEYNENYGVAYMYASSEARQKMLSLHKHIHSSNWINAEKELDEIIPIIANVIDNLK